MIRKIFFFIILTVALMGYAQNKTYQYKRVKIVENGVTKICNDDCHYITFTPNGCYESDSNGYTSNTSNTLTYAGTANGIRSYRGAGYYGNAMYYFADDLSRLNLYVTNQLIYVYERQPSLTPSGTMRQTVTAPTPGVAPVQPIQITPEPVDFSTKLPESYYREHYARWERVVQSAYQSLTTLGYDVRYEDGSRQGYTGSKWQSSTFTGMMSEMRKAQREMSNLRSEASRNGYYIPQSHWETVTVKNY